MRISDWSADVCSSDLSNLPGITMRPVSSCVPIPVTVDRVRSLTVRAPRLPSLSTVVRSVAGLRGTLPIAAPLALSIDRNSVLAGKRVVVLVDFGVILLLTKQTVIRYINQAFIK